MRTVAILPIKNFAGAKQRLGSGVPPEGRRSLAEAMFRDVLRALGQSRLIDEMLVVAGGDAPRQIAEQLATEQRLRVIQEDEERGHNTAAQLGIETAMRSGAERALLVPGDCPVLDPAELDGLVARPVVAPSVLIVPDRHGTGTNALLLTPPDALTPSFGPGSCERHRASAQAAGVHAEVVAVRSLATDVDTPDDLEALTADLESVNGAARATRRLLAETTLRGSG